MPSDTLAQLRRRLAIPLPVPAGSSAAGLPVSARWFAEALNRAALHEFYAGAEADCAAVGGFALALATSVTGQGPLLWVRQSFLDGETGAPYPHGLAELGISPDRLTLVRARDPVDALQAGLEGARCGALGAVIIELWGEARALDLTASRRLSLAARASGACVLMVRIAARPQPSAAETRWQVRAASSRGMAANAPGNPVFALTLLRGRGGLAGEETEGREWHLEWNRDRKRFEDRASDGAAGSGSPPGPPGSAAAVSGAVVPVLFSRPGAAGEQDPSFRQAG